MSLDEHVRVVVMASGKGHRVLDLTRDRRMDAARLRSIMTRHLCQIGSDSLREVAR